MYAFVVFLHMMSVLGFLLAHGASAAVMFRMKAEREPARIGALLDLSQTVGGAMAVTALALFLTGLALGFMGSWWGRGWIWASLLLFLAISVVMSWQGRLYFERLRRAVAMPTGAAREQKSNPPRGAGACGTGRGADHRSADVAGRRRPGQAGGHHLADEVQAVLKDPIQCACPLKGSPMADIAVRWGGLLFLGGALVFGAAVVVVSFQPVVMQAFTRPVNLLFLVASMLLLVALPGIYARQAPAAGWLGLAGYGLLQAGFILLALLAAPLLYPSLQGGPGESVPAFLLGISFTLGLLLTSIATIQAGIYPRGAGLLLLAGTAGFFFGFFIAEFLPPLPGQIVTGTLGSALALALAWMGLAAWMGGLGAN
jgi:hypothetical protein